MPRMSKKEVSAINLRIPVDRNRDYAELVEKLFELKSGVRVYGGTYVAISYFDKSTGIGVFSKYTEIDIDGEWFDVEGFDVASQEDLENISIPENLRPNHSAFYFSLDTDAHLITFEAYAESSGLSGRSVQKYFREILSKGEVQNRFGRVEADLVKSYSEVKSILELEMLKEIHLVIRRPNQDDVSGDLASEIEKRLEEQNGEEYEEVLRSKDNDGLAPNDRTKRLSMVAAENGKVSAKSIVNGVLVPHETDEKPLKVVDTFTKEDENSLGVFLRLSQQIVGEIQSSREAIRRGENPQ